MPQRNLAWLLLVPAFVFVAAVFAAVAPAPEREYQLVRSVVDVLAEVDKNYYRELTPDEKRRLVEDMINGGLYRLDKHAQYYNEDSNSSKTIPTASSAASGPSSRSIRKPSDCRSNRR
jgi:carboxyl-terminal processing protease